MNIKISTLLFPTESEEKVINALQNVFNTTFKIKKDVLVAETKKNETLDIIKQKITDSRIKTTALYLLEKNREDNKTTIELNKQALLKRKVHFVEEKYPLGNVIIEIDNVEEAAAYFSN